MTRVNKMRPPYKSISMLSMDDTDKEIEEKHKENNEDIKEANEKAQMKLKVTSKGDAMTNAFSSLRSDDGKKILKRCRNARKRKNKEFGG